MRFSDDFISRVRESTNIVDIISAYTELKRTGSNLMGRCPFPDHPEKTASFSVNENKQVYHCFGCKKGGDVFNFVERMRGQSFPEVIESLADRAGIALPVSGENQDEASRAREQKKKLVATNKYAGAFFRAQLAALPAQHPVREYMLSRGLTPEVCDEFKIGYAPSDRHLLVDYLISKRVPLELAEQLGLVRRSTMQGTASHYSLFRDRIMFPIMGVTEDVLGFGGRAFGEEMPKYINSQTSPLFDKSRTLYGLNLTARYIRSEDEVIVVEGYMDVIGLYVAGIKNVAAPLGTALTSEHAKLLGRMTKNIVVLFDGDSAGQTAAERSLPILLEQGLLARGLTLPGNLDPDEAVEEMGIEKLRALITRAEDLMTWQIRRELQNFRGQPTEKVQVLEKLGPILLRTQDPKLRDLYGDQLAERMRVERPWLYSSLAQLAQKLGLSYQVPQSARPNSSQQGFAQRSRPGAFKSSVPDMVAGLSREERLLLGLALSRSNLLDQILVSGVQQYLGQSKCNEIFEIIEKLYRHDKQPFDKLTVLLSDQIPDDSVRHLLTENLEKGFVEMVETGGDRAVSDVIDGIKAKFLKEEAEKLAEQLKTDNNPQTLERFMNIQKVRHSLKNS